MRPVKLLLFDIDGTLVATGGAGVRALNRAFRELLGIENAMERIRPHGKTDPGIIREVFEICGDARQCSDWMSRVLDAYVRFLPEEVSGSTTYKVLPGILRFLEEFHGRPDIAIGLATGNVEQGARIKLERGKLNRFFPFGGFGSDSESRAELVRRGAEKGVRLTGQSVKPGDIFVIGDTPRDIDAGREAGFRTVGVATSDYSVDQLKAAGADLVLSDFERERNRFLQLVGID
jgi:phosphoglycolate phosphatase-like HAD superfamily hydrolase